MTYDLANLRMELIGRLAHVLKNLNASRSRQHRTYIQSKIRNHKGQFLLSTPRKAHELCVSLISLRGKSVDVALDLNVAAGSRGRRIPGPISSLSARPREYRKHDLG